MDYHANDDGQTLVTSTWTLQLYFMGKLPPMFLLYPILLLKVLFTLPWRFLIQVPTIISTQLTHYKHPHSHVQPKCSCNRQTSHPNLYVTKTLVIWVTKTIPTHYKCQHIHMEFGCPTTDSAVAHIF